MKTASQGTLESSPGAAKTGLEGPRGQRQVFVLLNSINSALAPRLSFRVFRSRSPPKVVGTKFGPKLKSGISREESPRTTPGTNSGRSFRSRSLKKTMFYTYIFLKESVQICPVVLWGGRWSWSRKIGLSRGVFGGTPLAKHPFPEFGHISRVDFFRIPRAKRPTGQIGYNRNRAWERWLQVRSGC